MPFSNKDILEAIAQATAPNVPVRRSEKPSLEDLDRRAPRRFNDPNDPRKPRPSRD